MVSSTNSPVQFFYPPPSPLDGSVHHLICSVVSPTTLVDRWFHPPQHLIVGSITNHVFQMVPSIILIWLMASSTILDGSIQHLVGAMVPSTIVSANNNNIHTTTTTTNGINTNTIAKKNFRVKVVIKPPYKSISNTPRLTTLTLDIGRQK